MAAAPVNFDPQKGLKVDGRPVCDLDPYEIIYLIRGLPSSFDETRKPKEMGQVEWDIVARAAISSKVTGNSSVESAAVSYVTENLQVSTDLAEMLILKQLSFEAQRHGDFSEAESRARQAVVIGERLDAAPHLLPAYALLHRAVRKQVQEKYEQGDQAAGDELLKGLRETRRKVKVFSVRRKGEPVNPEAGNVEMGKMAISDQTLGCSNVIDCVAIMAQARPGQIMVAHLDGTADARSISEYFEQFGEEVTVQVRLLGGRNGLVRYATQNLIDLVEALRFQNVNIASSDLASFFQPKAFTLSPDFVVKEEHPDLDYEGFLADVYAHRRAEVTSFDSISHPRVPTDELTFVKGQNVATLLSNARNVTLRQVVERSVVEANRILYWTDSAPKWLKSLLLKLAGEDGLIDRVQPPGLRQTLLVARELVVVDAIHQFNEPTLAFMQATEPIWEALLAGGEAVGLSSAEIRGYVPRVLQTFGMYLGPTHEEANASLIDHLRHNFFDASTSEPKEGAYELDFGEPSKTGDKISKNSALRLRLNYLTGQYGRQDLTSRFP